ncbi:MAG: hypothetical protein ABR585_12875 [Gemmatimonadaceae bacterium]|nr:hypothetical protein [Actinomycetota bacterium]
MSEEEKAPESSDDDAFEELIKHQPEDDPDIETMWDGIKVLWKALGQEGILVKGILLLEYVDHRGKVLKWESSPDLAPWDILGMLHQAVADLNADTMADSIVQSIVHDSDDEDDVEDEQ